MEDGLDSSSNQAVSERAAAVPAAASGSTLAADDAVSIVTELLSTDGDPLPEDEGFHESMVVESVDPSEVADVFEDPMDTILPLFDVTDGVSGGAAASLGLDVGSAVLAAAAAAAASSAEGAWGSAGRRSPAAQQPSSAREPWERPRPSAAREVPHAAREARAGGGRLPLQEVAERLEMEIEDSEEEVAKENIRRLQAALDDANRRLRGVALSHVSVERIFEYSSSFTQEAGNPGAASSSTAPATAAVAGAVTVATAAAAAAPPTRAEEDLFTQFACPICLEVCEEAVETPCCHNLFCRGCLLSDEHIINRCPICKCELNSHRVNPNVPIRRMIDDLPFTCRFDGCGANLRRRDRQRHESVCGFHPVFCRLSDKCSMLLRWRLEKHETEECPYRPSTCPLCGHSMPLDMLDEHLGGQCPRALCQCPLCEESVRRADLPAHAASTCPCEPVTCDLPEHETRTVCGHRCQRRNIEEHRRSCSFQPASCRHEQCEHITTKRLLESHEESCQWRRLACPDCGEELFLGSVQEHLVADCPEHLVACPFACYGCGEVRPRRSHAEHLAAACGEHLAQLCEAVVEKDTEIQHLKGELGSLRAELEGRLGRLERLLQDRPGSYGSGARSAGAPSGTGRLPELASMAAAWASPASPHPARRHGGGAEGKAPGAPGLVPGERPVVYGPLPPPPVGAPPPPPPPPLPPRVLAPAPLDATGTSALRTMLRQHSRVLSAQQRVLSGGMPTPYTVAGRGPTPPRAAAKASPTLGGAQDRSGSLRSMTVSQFEANSAGGDSREGTPPSSARSSASEPVWEPPPPLSRPFLLRDTGVSQVPVFGSNPFGGLAIQRRRDWVRGFAENLRVVSPSLPMNRRVGPGLGLYQAVGYRGGGHSASAAPRSPHLGEQAEPSRVEYRLFATQPFGSMQEGEEGDTPRLARGAEAPPWETAARRQGPPSAAAERPAELQVMEDGTIEV